jgi:predicted transposase YdaD
VHEYDISLKLLLRGSSGVLLRALTGVEVTSWLDVEMPATQNTRVDLLGETRSGGLIHIELQSTNDATMPLRMLEYATRIFRIAKRFPRQILLYVGEAPFAMEADWTLPNLSFRYEVADIRDFDSEQLLESDQTGDNVIAVLSRLRDERSAVRRILTKLAGLKRAERDLAFQQLTMLAGLRSLEEFIEQEARKMPILQDIMDHKVIGRERKKGIAIGREEGREEGRNEGIHEGELKMLCRLIEKRFGPIPADAAKILHEKSLAELEELGLRILDVDSLTALLQGA